MSKSQMMATVTEAVSAEAAAPLAATKKNAAVAAAERALQDVPCVPGPRVATDRADYRDHGQRHIAILLALLVWSGGVSKGEAV
ncbi:hypothetical protein [Cupriavidus necator]